MHIKNKRNSIIFLLFIVYCMQAYHNYDVKYSYDSATHHSISRNYYESLIEKGTEHRWSIPLSFFYSVASRSFDDSSQSQDLAHLIFRKAITVRDIHLFSRLSDDNKVHVSAIGTAGVPNDSAELRFMRGSVPISGANGRPFGFFRDDLYTTLLANNQFEINAEQQEVGAHASAFYRFPIERSQNSIWTTIGITVPFKNREHTFAFHILGDDLFRAGLTPDVTFRENSLVQFFRDFSSIEDFFIRGILEPKGIQFNELQRKTGIGDIALIGFFDWAEYVDCCDGLQTGISLILPTAGRADGTKLWEVELGNGGFFQLDIFANVLCKTSMHVFNPFLQFVYSYSAPRTSNRRVARLVQATTAGQAVQSVETLLAPAFFNQYQLETFDEFDSLIPEFADTRMPIRTQLGHRVLIGLGNYWYDFFNLGFTLSALYQYVHKTEDSIKDTNCSSSLDTAGLINRTESRVHTISWNLTYKFASLIELGVGSLHIVAGKNVPRHDEFVASLLVTF